MKAVIVFSTWVFTLASTFAIDASRIPVTGEVEGITANRADFNGSLLQLRRAGRLGFQVRPVGKRAWSHTVWQRSSPFNPPGITFTGTATNLKFDTDYQVRAVAVVGGVLRPGNIVTFHSSTGSPEFISGVATNVTSSNAVITALFYPNAAPTLAWFEWGTSTNYGNITAPMSYPAGVAPQELTASLESLQPDFTTYHWRLVASNASGVMVSPDEAFIATDYVGLPEGYSWEFSTAMAYEGRLPNPASHRYGTVVFNFMPGSFSSNGVLVCEFPPVPPIVDVPRTVVTAPAEGGALTSVNVLWGLPPQARVRFTSERGSVVLTNLSFTYQESTFFQIPSDKYSTNIDLRIRH